MSHTQGGFMKHLIAFLILGSTAIGADFSGFNSFDLFGQIITLKKAVETNYPKQPFKYISMSVSLREKYFDGNQQRLREVCRKQISLPVYNFDQAGDIETDRVIFPICVMNMNGSQIRTSMMMIFGYQTINGVFMKAFNPAFSFTHNYKGESRKIENWGEAYGAEGSSRQFLHLMQPNTEQQTCTDIQSGEPVACSGQSNLKRFSVLSAIRDY